MRGSGVRIPQPAPPQQLLHLRADPRTATRTARSLRILSSPRLPSPAEYRLSGEAWREPARLIDISARLQEPDHAQAKRVLIDRADDRHGDHRHPGGDCNPELPRLRDTQPSARGAGVYGEHR